MTGQAHPVALQPAPYGAAARRHLLGRQRRAAEAPGPVGCQGAVGGAGHRVLGNALRRREETGDEVDGVPRRGSDDGEGVEPGNAVHVGAQVAHLVLGVEDGEGVAGAQHLDRLGAQRRRQVGGVDVAPRLRRPCRKVHRQPVAVAGDGQGPAAAVEGDRIQVAVEAC